MRVKGARFVRALFWDYQELVDHITNKKGKHEVEEDV
jgi:hypothetical protein